MTNSRIIARWLTQDELSGSKKSVTVGPDQAAIVITDGVYGEPETEGKIFTKRWFKLGGGSDIEVLIVDTTRFGVSFAVHNDSRRDSFGIPIMTKDGKVVTGKVVLSLAVNRDNAGRLFQLRQGRSQVTDQDIASALRDDLFTQVIRPNVARVDSVELRGSADEFAVLYGDTQLQLDSLLNGYGLKLQSFAPALIPASAMTSAALQQISLQKKTKRARAEADRSGRASGSGRRDRRSGGNVHTKSSRDKRSRPVASHSRRGGRRSPSRGR